jgi:hypothetical protein
VQSITDNTGRRTLKFTRIAPDTGLVRTPVKRRKSPLRLTLLVAPETQFSFEPVIQVRSRANS